VEQIYIGHRQEYLGYGLLSLFAAMAFEFRFGQDKDPFDKLLVGHH